jgi:hypothetical protein
VATQSFLRKPFSALYMSSNRVTSFTTLGRCHTLESCLIFRSDQIRVRRDKMVASKSLAQVDKLTDRVGLGYSSGYSTLI